MREHELLGGVYEHYKGGLYLVLGVGAHSETDELMVVYVALTGSHLPGPRMRIRPLSLFQDAVVWPSGVTADRFVFKGDVPTA
jgi:hypothetical protein